MDKIYRQVKCPGIDCPNVLRIAVSEDEYGKRLRVKCPRCFSLVNVVVPVPIKEEDQVLAAGAEEEETGLLDEWSKLFQFIFKKKPK